MAFGPADVLRRCWRRASITGMTRAYAYALPLTAALLCTLASKPADACGGTVCDQGPNAMPVDQTGENILFVLDQGEVEVHIQIQYDPNTNAQQFAWLIPLPSVPDFSVGTELLFQELLRATVPQYGLQDNFDFCGGGTDGGSTGTSGASTSGGDPGTTGDTGVDVKKIETVGAFEIVVLAAANAADIMMWLGDNGYQQDPNAEPILQEYLDEGNVVVAFKLSHGEGLKSIHPIVLNFPAPDGCIPIRLTRIAAVDDMDIRVFALGDGRAIPTNYRHVLVNPLKIDWLNFGSNYKEVVSLAVDAFMAEGHAFVTEFGGGSDVLNEFSFYSANWVPGVFSGLPAVNVIDTLNAQGLTDCSDSFFCQYNHPLIEGLLATYVPVPMGLAPEDFYSCLSCYEAMIDPMAWGDGSDFAKDLQTRVVEPAEHAKLLVDTWPYLSRLYTTISPAEMTEDPLFLFNPELPDVANLRIANRNISCEDHAVVTLPDGRVVHMDFGAPWPDFQQEMPWEEDVDQMVMDGMPQPLIDNTALIDMLLQQWNDAHPPPQSGTGTDTDTSGGPTSTDTDAVPTESGGISSGASSSSSTTGPYSTESDSTPNVVGGGEPFACSCSNDARGPGLPGLLALLGLVAIRPRRRRR